jgi:hypothetical protein
MSWWATTRFVDGVSALPQGLRADCVVAVVNSYAPPIWAGLEVRTCPALRRTHLTVYGAVDDERIAEIREAIADALARGHKVTFDFESLTMVVRHALGELLALAEESTQP